MSTIVGYPTLPRIGTASLKLSGFFSEANLSADKGSQAFVKANPIERKLHKDEEDVGKPIQHEITNRAWRCGVAEAQLHEEQIEQEGGGEC